MIFTKSFTCRDELKVRSNPIRHLFLAFLKGWPLRKNVTDVLQKLGNLEKPLIIEIFQVRCQKDLWVVYEFLYSYKPYKIRFIIQFGRSAFIWGLLFWFHIYFIAPYTLETQKLYYIISKRLEKLNPNQNYLTIISVLFNKLLIFEISKSLPIHGFAG